MKIFMRSTTRAITPKSRLPTIPQFGRQKPVIRMCFKMTLPLFRCIEREEGDFVMLVLFGKISDDIVAISNSEKDQLNQVANTQVVAATAKMALSKMDLYANLLNQMVNTYNYFSSNPYVNTDLETASPPLPHLTTSFTNASYH